LRFKLKPGGYICSISTETDFKVKFEHSNEMRTIGLNRGANLIAFQCVDEVLPVHFFLEPNAGIIQRVLMPKQTKFEFKISGVETVSYETEYLDSTQAAQKWNQLTSKPKYSDKQQSINEFQALISRTVIASESTPSRKILEEMADRCAKWTEEEKIQLINAAMQKQATMNKPMPISLNAFMDAFVKISETRNSARNCEAKTQDHQNQNLNNEDLRSPLMAEEIIVSDC